MPQKIKNIGTIMRLLKKEVGAFEKPMSTEISERTRSPFQVLVSCLMSLRTKDTITAPTSAKLFAVADTPEKIMKMPLKRLETIIRPVNYYKTKARRIKEICRQLVTEHNSNVPDSFDELMKFKGVGKKTAAIVMVYGHHNYNYIPTDVHVHKIPNRLGWIKTRTPEESMDVLMKIIPKEYWSELNDLLVKHGQNVCSSPTPKCSVCAISKYCLRIGVKKSR